jgi:hypothetical protein
MRLRRTFILNTLSAVAAFAAAPATSNIRGKLTQQDGKPAIETSSHKLVALDGDEPTRGILNDKRLAGAEMEATGHFTAAGLFMVDPIHTKALHVYKDGKRRTISYWCDTCSIRTYTPGICWCCQQETALDLQDDDKK